MIDEPENEQTVHEGPRFSVKRAQFPGGRLREWVATPDAVAVVAYDDENVYLVRQPREAIQRDDVLELPAGIMDEEGESPLETAKRELAEEIGKAAEHWEFLTSFYTTPGFSDEKIDVYVATGLSDAHAEAEENERIEIRTVPLDELDDVIRGCKDAKSLIALLWFRAYGGWRQPPAA